MKYFYMLPIKRFFSLEGGYISLNNLWGPKSKEQKRKMHHENMKCRRNRVRSPKKVEETEKTWKLNAHKVVAAAKKPAIIETNQTIRKRAVMQKWGQVTHIIRPTNGYNMILGSQIPRAMNLQQGKALAYG